MRDFRYEARRCGGFSEQHSVGCGFPKNQHTLLSMRLSFLVTTTSSKTRLSILVVASLWTETHIHVPTMRPSLLVLVRGYQRQSHPLQGVEAHIHKGSAHPYGSVFSCGHPFWMVFSRGTKKKTQFGGPLKTNTYISKCKYNIYIYI